jgi:dihydroorotase
VTIWIKGGEVVDPARGTVKKSDILVERGRVVKVMPPESLKEGTKGLRIVDASDKLIVPGLIDMHVHLREPGHEYKETIATGAKAGVAGGFTGLACMSNTYPVNDSRSVTEFILRQAAKAKLLRVYPMAALTKGQQGASLTEFGDLCAAGAVAVSDDGLPVLDSELMRRALEYASYHGLAVISHCEDLTLSEGGDMHEGRISTRIGLRGIPAASEEIMVFRDISLARLTGCPLHIAHVSTAGSVALIKKAKEDGIPVTAETAPHYFSLDHRAVVGFDTHAKMKPPLRTPEDVLAIKKGLAEDIIDVIATDHAPHSPLEKEVEFDKAAFGIIGLETAVSLTLALVREGVLDLPQAFRKMSHVPAKILGLPPVSLEAGARADLAIIDPEREWVLRADDIYSKSRNSPFIGQALKGKNELTMVGGRVVWKATAKHPRR